MGGDQLLNHNPTLEPGPKVYGKASPKEGAWSPQNAQFWVAAATAYGGHLAGAGGSISIKANPEHTAQAIAALAEALWRQAQTDWSIEEETNG